VIGRVKAPVRETVPFGVLTATCRLKRSKRTAALKAWIEAKPGAVPEPFSARKGSAPIAIIYKFMDKIFAILSVRRIENVILKCDSHLAKLLREAELARLSSGRGGARNQGRLRA